jgi:hypothetical protein
MKEYRIRNKSTNQWWQGKAENFTDACAKAGWSFVDCEIKERTFNGCGGWKKADVGK